MKLVPEHINEAIKHLTPRTEEEVKDFLKNSKVAFFHSDTDEFEYKGKKRIYTLTANVASFLRTKDYLVYLDNKRPLGYIEAKKISSWIYGGYGSIYYKKHIYDNHKLFLKYLCSDKYPINESIKHLSGRSEEEIRDFKQSLLDEVYKVYEIVIKYPVAFKILIKPFFYKDKASMLFENRRNSKYQYSYEFNDAGFGTFMILKPNDIQRFHARELDYLEEIIKKEAKLKVFESIKHLTPKSKEEIKKGILELPVKERLPAAVRHDIEFTPEEMEQYKKDLHDYIMSQPFHLVKKAAIQWNIELTPEDIQQIDINQINKYKKLKQVDKDKTLINAIKWNDDERIEYLLKAGANVNTNEGRPLRQAVEDENISLVKLLLKFGADPTLKDNLAIRVAKKRIKDIESEAWFTINKERDITRCMQIIKMIRDYESKTR